MSIKTSKRIALGVIASLVFAPFAAIAPASAAVDSEATAAEVTAVGLSGTGNTFLVGNVVTFTATVTPNTPTDGDDVTVKATITAQPGSLPVTLTATKAGANVTDGTDTCTNTEGTAGVVTQLGFECAGANGANFATALTLGTFKFTPANTGTYTISAWHDADADGTINGTEKSTTASITITTAGIGLTEFSLSNQTTNNTHTSVMTVAVTAAQNSARVGTQVAFTPAFTIKTLVDAGTDTRTRKATASYALTKPTGSAAALSSTSAVKVGASAALADNATETITFANVTFTPDVAGTYTLNAWHDADADGLIDNGEASGSLAVVVSADAIAMTIKAYNATALAGDWDTDARGSLVQLTLTNGGVAASLSASERIRVSVSSGEIELKHTSAASTAELSATTLDLVRDDFDAKGRVWLTFSGADATTQVVTFDGIGGGVDSLLQTQSISYKAGAGVYDSIAIASTMTTGVLQNTGLAIGGADGAYDTDVLKATALKMTVSLTAADAVGALHIKDNGSLLTGLANLEYSGVVTGATTAAGTVTVTLPTMGGEATAVAGTSAYQFSMGATLATDIGVVTLQTATDAAANTALDQASVLRAVNGSTVTLSMVIKDQFKVARANEVVAISIAGRNAHVTSANKISDADGRVSFSYTDAPLVGVVSTQDVITFNQDNGTDKTYTVNYVADLGVSTVTLGGGNNSATGVALTSPAIKDISATDGAEEGVQTITATIKDTSGSVLVGVPVSWTVSDAGTKANILSTTATTYSDATGKATTSVYAWINGTYTVTATAGGVTATVTIDFRQTAGGGEERTVTAAASGKVATATVKDRFGNPVPGVTVYASLTGDAYFGAGTKTASGTTDLNGQAAFVVGGSDTTVTVSTIDPAVVGAKGSGQTCAAAGNADCAATPTAFAAYTAGTATTAEEGVGASLSAAGVASATASVTGITPAEVVAPAEKPTLAIEKSGGRIYLSGTAADGEGDIIIYVKRVGTSAWKERAKTLEVAAPGDFNGSIKAPKNNVVIRVKQEGTGLFSNQVIALR